MTETGSALEQLPTAAERFPADVREPGPRTKAQITRAQEQYQQRPVRVSVRLDSGAGQQVKISTPHRDQDGWADHLHNAMGTSSQPFANTIIAQLAMMLGKSFETISADALNGMLAAVESVEPANETEAMLAAQMAGTHHLAMELMQRSKWAADRVAMNDYGNLATKMLRTYTTQVEALAKIRRGGKQNVEVKHVHVYPGGQAIVGAVDGRGVGAFNGSQQQAYGPDAGALAYAPGAEMWCPEPLGEALPVAGNQGQEAVPASRRRGRQRGSRRSA